jgi:DNA-binding NtrC family response regulator
MVARLGSATMAESGGFVATGGHTVHRRAPSLVVVEAGHYVEFPIAPSGEVIIGGDSGHAVVTLRDAAVAPVHARVRSEQGKLVVVPHAGETRLNGELLRHIRPLSHGDVIGIGAATIVVRCAGTSADRILSPEELAMRLDAEVERAVRYARALTVLVVERGDADPHALASAAVLAVRSADVVGISREGDVIVLMPETSDAAAIPARRLLRAVEPLGPRVRIGYAACPTHGSDAESLVSSARAAAGGAREGECGVIAPEPRPRMAGDVALIARDPAMMRVLAVVERLARSDITVLIGGETGAGKEVIAKALHAWSNRKDAPFVAINCAAVPEQLLESELFGHERGAFSGATTSKPGLFEAAHGGTIFLDEIGECSGSAQAKLLRVFETKRVTRVGALAPREVDVRIVAATNRSLADEVTRGRFRQDLLFRLDAASVMLPPLRERPLDIPALANAFLEDACAREKRPPLSLGRNALEHLAAHGWPGNVRELRNLMAFVAATAQGPVVEPADLVTSSGTFRAVQIAKEGPIARRASAQIPITRSLYDEIRDLERRRIGEALEACGGVRVRAAERIGIPLRTLVTKIKEYGLADVGLKGRAAGEDPMP